MTYNNSMVFIETTHFTHWISRYLKDEEYSELQSYLMEYPEAGNLIQGTGEIRKLRWARKGRGKSGGARIIYYWAKSRCQIYLLTADTKNERENIDTTTLNRIAKRLGEMK